MEREAFHTIVIGAGSGGLTVGVGIANFGHPVAVIEALHVGGDCTNVGCVPSKTLIHQANRPEGKANPIAALTEVRRKRDALREKETHEFGEVPNLSLIHARASLLSRERVALEFPDGSRREISAKYLVVATGARPRGLAIAGLPEERALTNETIFELPVLPRHLAIIGGGVIGSEMAFAFRKLGSRVSIMDHGPRMLAPYIPEASEVVMAAMEQRGIAVLTKTSVRGYDAAREVLTVERDGRPIELDGVDYVLIAIGRQRNVEQLNLEAAGVAYTAREGIATDSFGRTNVANIYAIGDVTRTSAFTHSANAQGRRVVQRIMFPALPARAPEPFYPTATFSDPEVATAGMNRRMIAERYHPSLIRTLRVDLPTATDRGYTDDLKGGFILVDAMRLTGKVLGVTIVAPRASEMISFFSLAVAEGISLFKIYRIVFPYPTFSSGIQRIADAFLRETLPHLRRELGAYLRYRWAKPSSSDLPQQRTA